jgi:hypothetical protein
MRLVFPPFDSSRDYREKEISLNCMRISSRYTVASTFFYLEEVSEVDKEEPPRIPAGLMLWSEPKEQQE